MRIAFIYDDQNDYLITDKLLYADFCLEEEANTIICSLRELGHDVIVIKGREALKRELQNLNDVDMVFNKTEGFKSRNREGLVPALLELMEIPFTGTDAYGFSLSLNKYHTKLIAKDNGILTPKFVIINDIKECYLLYDLRFPIIIKPNNEGSSMGCQVFYEMSSDLCAEISNLLGTFNQPVLVEEYITGIDISVPIIGTNHNAKCLGIVEFCNADGTYPEIASTKFKYVDDYQTRILMRNSDVIDEIKANSLKIYKALGCKDYGRVDFRLCDEKAFFLEINPLPTLCKNGAFDICAQNKKMTMTDVIGSIVDSAIDE